MAAWASSEFTLSAKLIIKRSRTSRACPTGYGRRFCYISIHIDRKFAHQRQ